MRVAALDIKSTPRLELLGALILTRIIARVRKTLRTLLHLSEVYCWTHNTGVLYWIKITNNEYKQLVENRLREIRKLTQPESWAYVLSSSNPADIPSRGMTAQQLIDCDLWWYGPSWLCLYKSDHDNTAEANFTALKDMIHVFSLNAVCQKPDPGT